jgi:CBS domain-containing protein
MSSTVRTVGPEVRVPDLGRAFIEEKRSSFPVVHEGRLVGIVSRSDVVRQLCVEQAFAETVAGFYVDLGGGADDEPDSSSSVGGRVGSRIEELRVRDVMIHDPVTVGPDDSLRKVATLLVEKNLHRLPVVEDGRLLGIVSSLDLARVVAEGRGDSL